MVLEHSYKTKKGNSKPPISTTFGGTQLIDELKGIRAFELVSKATNACEKIIWGVVLIGGMAWAAQWLVNEFQSWQLHPTIISQQNVKWSDIPNPAITICSQSSTKYAIAERLGNYFNAESSLPDELIEIREMLLKYVIGYLFYDLHGRGDPACFPVNDCKVTSYD